MVIPQSALVDAETRERAMGTIGSLKEQSNPLFCFHITRFSLEFHYLFFATMNFITLRATKLQAMKSKVYGTETKTN